MNPDLLQRLLSEFRAKQLQANQANESRFQRILGPAQGAISESGYRGRETFARGELDKGFKAGQKRIAKRFAKTRGQIQLQGKGRGFAASSMLPQLDIAATRDESDAQEALEEQIRRERIGTLTGLAGDTLGFQERKQEIGPDPSQLLSLAGGLGRASGGGGIIQGQRRRLVQRLGQNVGAFSGRIKHDFTGGITSGAFRPLGFSFA